MIGDSHQIEFYSTTIRLISRLSSRPKSEFFTSRVILTYSSLRIRPHITHRLKKQQNDPGNSPPIQQIIP